MGGFPGLPIPPGLSSVCNTRKNNYNENDDEVMIIRKVCCFFFFLLDARLEKHSKLFMNSILANHLCILLR